MTRLSWYPFAAAVAGILATWLVASGAAIASETGAGQTSEKMTNSIGMQLIVIPAGQFEMGTEEDRVETLNFFPYCDPKWLDGERPQHEVLITKSFWMGQCEVTLRELLVFHFDAGYKLDCERDGKPSLGYASDGKTLIESHSFRPWAPGWRIEQDNPAVYVSWNDATAFCRWLSKREGKTYRLPTEAEWEYACRAGTSYRYFFGNDPQQLVFYGNVADADRKAVSGNARLTWFDGSGREERGDFPFPFVSRRDGYAWTAPVGKFHPNPFELYDMHGNVWEWCSDFYDENYYERSPLEDPQGPSSGDRHVARGGGFYSSAVDLRCARRDRAHASYRDFSRGFRVVCERQAASLTSRAADKGR